MFHNRFGRVREREQNPVKKRPKRMMQSEKLKGVPIIRCYNVHFNLHAFPFVEFVFVLFFHSCHFYTLASRCELIWFPQQTSPIDSIQLDLHEYHTDADALQRNAEDEWTTESHQNQNRMTQTPLHQHAWGENVVRTITIDAKSLFCVRIAYNINGKKIHRINTSCV